MKDLFNVIGVWIAMIASVVAVWSFFFMFNTATAEIFKGNMYGLICVGCCLSTIVIAWFAWKGLVTRRKCWYKYGLILAIIEILGAFGFAYDYDRNYDKWVDGTIYVDGLGDLPAQFEVFDVYPHFMQPFLFGLGYMDLVIMTFLGYGIAYLLSLFLTKKRTCGSTVWSQMSA